jgi:hypothetical protein
VRAGLSRGVLQKRRIRFKDLRRSAFRHRSVLSLLSVCVQGKEWQMENGGRVVGGGGYLADGCGRRLGASFLNSEGKKSSENWLMVVADVEVECCDVVVIVM